MFIENAMFITVYFVYILNSHINLLPALPSLQPSQPLREGRVLGVQVLVAQILNEGRVGQVEEIRQGELVAREVGLLREDALVSGQRLFKLGDQRSDLGLVGGSAAMEGLEDFLVGDARGRRVEVGLFDGDGLQKENR